MTRVAVSLVVALLAVGVAGCGETKAEEESAARTTAQEEQQEQAQQRRQQAREQAERKKEEQEARSATSSRAAPSGESSSEQSSGAGATGGEEDQVGSSSHATDAQFCQEHQCIGSFTTEQGTIVECSDGSYSHAGGISGACSDHGGEAGKE